MTAIHNATCLTQLPAVGLSLKFVSLLQDGHVLHLAESSRRVTCEGI